MLPPSSGSRLALRARIALPKLWPGCTLVVASLVVSSEGIGFANNPYWPRTHLVATKLAPYSPPDTMLPDGGCHRCLLLACPCLPPIMLRGAGSVCVQLSPPCEPARRHWHIASAVPCLWLAPGWPRMPPESTASTPISRDDGREFLNCPRNPAKYSRRGRQQNNNVTRSCAAGWGLQRRCRQNCLGAPGRLSEARHLLLRLEVFLETEMRMQPSGTTLWAVECRLGHLHNFGICNAASFAPNSRGFVLEVQPRVGYRLLPGVPMLAFASMCGNLLLRCCWLCLPLALVASPIDWAWEAVC